MRATLVFLTLVAFVACGDGDDGTGPDGNGGTDGNGGNGGGTPTLSGDVQPIFTQRCALSGCHIAPDPEEGMDLSDGLAFANTVGVPSNQSQLLRIDPGAPDDSYLVHKIQGTQGDVGGSGSRMPLTGCCLTSAQITLIRDWISAGALNN